jgi:intein/homing endonuclease
MVRTTDGRFIEKRVLIDKKLLKQIIFQAKDKNDFTWNTFSSILGVSPQVIRHDWLITGRTLPLSKFTILKKLSGFKVADFKIVEPYWGQKLSLDKRNTKEIIIPNKKDEKLAEFYGILLGDGCIFSNFNGISITGDKIVDYAYYHTYLTKLISDLFGITPTIYFDPHDRTMRLIVYSRELARYLKSLGFPVGVKYGHNPIIPKFIYENKISLAYCIRGLMDTDGSLSSHPHSKIMVHISITIKSLRESVYEGLNELGIKGGLFDKGIMLYSSEKVKKFYEIVGFSNFKNQYKYEAFVKTGKVPSAKEVETFIMQGKNI